MIIVIGKFNDQPWVLRQCGVNHRSEGADILGETKIS